MIPSRTWQNHFIIMIFGLALKLDDMQEIEINYYLQVNNYQTCATRAVFLPVFWPT